MNEKELRKRVDTTINDTKSASQEVYNALNKGQQKKLMKNPEVKALFDRYEIGGD